MLFIIGTLLSRIAGENVLKPIMKLSEATKKVANGDFNIQVDENGLGQEI